VPDGKLSNSSCSVAMVPVETWISISKDPVNELAEGIILARPLMSLCALLSFTLRIIGVPVGLKLGSPGASVKLPPAGRSTVEKVHSPRGLDLAESKSR
jgi:hypothetical protein